MIWRNFCDKIVAVRFFCNFPVWKNDKFSLTEKKIRQINYLVISLVKPLLSRKFCKKSVREIHCNYIHSVEKCKIYSRLTEKKFRQINYLVISLVKTLLSRNFCKRSLTVNFPHTCIVEKREILSHWKKNSSNQLFSDFFSKTIAFTKFLRKSVRENFCIFHTV